MKTVESANVISGFGIEGDRHATSEGVRTARQVLLMDDAKLKPLGLSRGDVRENITTSGIDLHSLPAGQRVGPRGRGRARGNGPLRAVCAYGRDTAGSERCTGGPAWNAGDCSSGWDRQNWRRRPGSGDVADCLDPAEVCSLVS